MRTTVITSAAGCLAAIALLAPTVARADTVTDWNGSASNAIVATAGRPPSVAVLSNKNATTRSWRSLSEALRENINARVWAGIHFRQADVAGVALGKNVARYLHDHDLQPRF
jgi:hypothetical protein